MGRVDNKTALVTGEASGIGLQSSKRLVAEGAKVMMTDINNKAGFKAGPTRLPMAAPDSDFKSRFDVVMNKYDIDLPIN